MSSALWPNEEINYKCVLKSLHDIRSRIQNTEVISFLAYFGSIRHPSILPSDYNL